MSIYYVLRDGKPVEASLAELTLWLQCGAKGRQVGDDILSDGTRISTVFLWIDHAFRKFGSPVLWETMIFGGPHDQYQERYTSREDAIKGHEKALRIARGEENTTQKEENS